MRAFVVLGRILPRPKMILPASSGREILSRPQSSTLFSALLMTERAMQGRLRCGVTIAESDKSYSCKAQQSRESRTT